VRKRRDLAVLIWVTLILSQSVRGVALEARVTRVRVSGARIWALLELRDLLRGNFLKLVREGRAVFLQVQAELWEDRRVFDRAVVTAAPATFRIDRDADARSVILTDQYGGSVPQAGIRAPVPLHVELGPANRLEDEATYYVHALVTAATVDERDIEQASEAIFGDDQSTQGLAALGRTVFRTLMRMGKYFESASTEVASRHVSGREIKSGAF
jgi:hypothetical protein